MFTTRTKLAGLLILPLLATACVSSTSSTYSGGDVGNVIETEPGTVVSARIVDIKGGENSGVGAVAGAAAGGTAGYAVGSGDSRGLTTVLGGLAGAGAGYLAERSLRGREGIEYVIRMDDGRVITLVQNRAKEEEPLPAGAPILVQYGATYTRVIEQPSSGDESRPSEWANPDEQPQIVPPDEGAPQQPGA